jgi:hypothetical protein
MWITAQAIRELQIISGFASSGTPFLACSLRDKWGFSTGRSQSVRPADHPVERQTQPALSEVEGSAPQIIAKKKQAAQGEALSGLVGEVLRGGG